MSQVYKVKCPKCGAEFSSEVKKKYGKVACPKCGNDVDLKYTKWNKMERLNKLYEKVVLKEGYDQPGFVKPKFKRGDRVIDKKGRKGVIITLYGQDELVDVNLDGEPKSKKYRFTFKQIKKESISPLDKLYEKVVLKEFSTLDKIYDIDGDIMDKYNLTSGRDMLKHKDEFIKALKKAGIRKISKQDADKLEDDNYHTSLDIIRKAGMIKESLQEAWKIEDVRKIVKDKQAKKIDGVLVDMQTANIMTQVFDALKQPGNKVKAQSMPIARFAKFAWKAYK